MAKRTNVEPYRAAYKQQVVELLGHIWKGTTFEERKTRFEWRYEQNPFTDQPVAFVAVKNERVVGLRAFTVQRLTVADASFLACSPSDAIVHPDARRQGVFTAMTREALRALEESDISMYLNLSSNEKSTPGYLKLGWVSVRPKRYLYRPFMTALIPEVIGRSRAPSQTMPVVQRHKAGGEFQLTETVHGDELAACGSRCDYLQNQRSEAFYRWRYERAHKQFQILYYRNKAALDGYFILRSLRNSRFEIVEFDYEDLDALQILLSHAQKLLRMSLLKVCDVALLPEEKSLFERNGFWQEPHWLHALRGGEPQPILVRPTRVDYEEEDFYLNGRDMRDITNWRLQVADVH